LDSRRCFESGLPPDVRYKAVALPAAFSLLNIWKESRPADFDANPIAGQSWLADNRVEHCGSFGLWPQRFHFFRMILSLRLPGPKLITSGG
jgi:hypothetical protein